MTETPTCEHDFNLLDLSPTIIDYPSTNHTGTDATSYRLAIYFCRKCLHTEKRKL